MRIEDKHKNTIQWIGIDYETGKIKMAAVIYIGITFMMISSCILVICSDDSNNDITTEVCKSLILISVFLYYFTNYLLSWKDFKLVLNIIEQGHSRVFNYYPSIKRESIIKEMEQDIKKQTKIMQTSLIIYLILVNSVPIISNLLTIIDKNDITVNDLSLFIAFYYPKGFETLPVYFIVYCLQFLLTLYYYWLAYLTHLSPINAMQIIITDLKFLTLAFQEMDIVHVSNGLVREFKGRNFIRQVVQHHQFIIKKVDELTKGIQRIFFFMNVAIPITLCASLYFLVKNVNIMFQLSEAYLLLLELYILYSTDAYGEEIITQHENFKQALYQSPWIKKPIWFKRSYLIIMTRANIQIEIKLFGLLGLNLRNLMLPIQTAYSYYNLLSTVK